MKGSQHMYDVRYFQMDDPDVSYEKTIRTGTDAKHKKLGAQGL